MQLVELIALRRTICAACRHPCPTKDAGEDVFGDEDAICPAPEPRWLPWSLRPSLPAPLEPPLPSIAERARNFSVAVVKEGKAAAQGIARPTDELIEERRAICRSNACGKYRESDDTCAACGCPATRKSRWRSANCPLGHWGPVGADVRTPQRVGGESKSAQSTS